MFINTILGAELRSHLLFEAVVGIEWFLMLDSVHLLMQNCNINFTDDMSGCAKVTCAKVTAQTHAKEQGWCSAALFGLHYLPPIPASK